MKRNSYHHQSGFSLLEVLLAVTIAIGLGSLQLGQLKNKTESQFARIVGQQQRSVGNALNAYIAQYYGNIVNMSSVSAPGTAADPGPRNCNTSTKICTISSDTLRRAGFLPASFSGINSFGSTYNYYIRVSGTSPNWNVDGIVVTNDPFTVGGEIRNDLIGEAMLEAGADSGTTRSVATQINGYNGTWLETGFPVNKLGLLAFRAGYGTFNYSAYLRVDGTLPMTGDLQLTSEGASETDYHNILRVNNIEGVGKFTAGQFVTKNNRTDAVVLGTGTSQTQLGNDNNKLKIANTGGLELVNSTTSAYTDLVAGNITGTGNLTISGWGVFDGTVNSRSLKTVEAIEAGSSVYAHTNVVADGGFSTTNGNYQTTNGNVSALNGTVQSKDLITTGTGYIGSTLTVSGNTNLYGDLQMGSSGLHYNSSTNTLSTLNNGNITSTGSITGNRIITLASGSANSGCAGYATGTMALDSSTGQVLGCNGSKWVGAAVTATYTVNGGSGTSSSASCGNDKVTGCSFSYISRVNYDDPQVPSSVYVSGNSCVVSGSAYFQAVATCSR